MNSALVAVAVDLGASSGRHVAGQFSGRQLELTELHRFENGPINAAGRMHWDLLQQWSHVQAGLQLAAQQYGQQVQSVGVDTWGVDFALLSRSDELLSNPVHYRDHRTDGILEQALAVVPRSEIFAHSGLQFMQINTLYQLLAMHWAKSPLLESAAAFLMMPDVFHWLLSGEKGNEFTNATTTQFFDPVKHAWSTELLDRFGLPTGMLQKIVEPGTQFGLLRSDVAQQTGLTQARVIVPGTHDTASAVLAVPAQGAVSEQPDWCYISSGTWSLMGLELPAPVVNEHCLKLNFTNEGGIGRTTRLLKNIGGLWVVQECRRIWRAAGQDYSWSELIELAQAAEPLRSIIDPDHASFLAPSNMPQAIQEYCQQTGQPVPESPGQVIRTALESLALKYRQVLGWLTELTGGNITTIHIVGGGSSNQLLNQFAANATQCRVVAGPIEATAIGNIAMQYISLGVWSNVNEARQVIRSSFPVVEYLPERNNNWDDAYATYLKLSPG